MSETDTGLSMSTQHTFAEEKHCTEFTMEHGQTDLSDDVFRFGFVCPQCGRTNPLKGDPMDFRYRPFRCVGCTWVAVLDGMALERFVSEVCGDE